MANTVATVEHSSAPAPEHEAEGGLLTAPFFISLAMVVIVLGLIWKKVPAAIGKALDSKIDVIRQQLSEAETLRKDAEALKAEYEKKAKAADKEAASIVERAKHEAEAIVAQAKDNADALVDRRQRMAEEKIAAEERAAELLVDDRHAFAVDAVRHRDLTAAPQRHSECREVTGADRLKARGQALLSGVDAGGLNQEPAAPAAPQRQAIAKSDAAHAGHRGDAIGEGLEQRQPYRRFRLRRQRDVGGKHPARVEAEIDAVDGDEAAHHERRADQQHHR